MQSDTFHIHAFITLIKITYLLHVKGAQTVRQMDGCNVIERHK